MSDTTLLARIGSRISELRIDATLSETHQSEVTTTPHPVEKGANITDHAREENDKLTLECFVSNTPLTASSSNPRTVEMLGAKLTTTASETQPQGQPGKAEETYKRLLELKSKRELITVMTTLRDYEDMILKTLTVPRDSKTGDGLRFTAVFEEMRIVESKTTTKTTKRSSDPKGSKKKDQGKQPTKETDKPKYQSALKVALGSP